MNPICSRRWAMEAESNSLGPCRRGPTLEAFVVTALIQLLCRVTKLGWFEDDAYHVSPLHTYMYARLVV